MKTSSTNENCSYYVKLGRVERVYLDHFGCAIDEEYKYYGRANGQHLYRAEIGEMRVVHLRASNITDARRLFKERREIIQSEVDSLRSNDLDVSAFIAVVEPCQCECK